MKENKSQQELDEQKREEARAFIPGSAWETHQRISSLEERVTELEETLLKLSEKVLND